MALTQMQIIQSLGEAMSWFERELAWGVQPAELRHLCGRIGELYAALITNGQMAASVNEHGYDVVSALGERISVKTTTNSDGQGSIRFNLNTLDRVDRIIILKVNTEEMQIDLLLDESMEKVKEKLSQNGNLSLNGLVKSPKPRGEIGATAEVRHGPYLIRELENGTIEVEQDGVQVQPVKPILREVAKGLHLTILNSNGNPFNTRQLGWQIIKNILSTSTKIA